MKKVAYYIRCSTPDQEPTLQIRDIDTICNEPHEIFKENQSAWAENVERPIFNGILDLIKKKKLKELYVWDLDRIYRNRKRLQQFFILCKANKCKIYSYRQKWLQDINAIPEPFNEIVFDLLINITGWMGQEESQKRSERVLLSVKRKNGVAYSYKGNRWGRKSLPKQTIDKIMDLHRQGKSIREIASLVMVTDKNKNQHPISKSAVHKTIVQNTQEKGSK